MRQYDLTGKAAQFSGLWVTGLRGCVAFWDFVHIYYEGSDPAYINSRLFGIHMQSDAVSEVALLGHVRGEIVELFDGGEAVCENGRFTFARRAGFTKLFLFEQGEFSRVTKG